MKRGRGGIVLSANPVSTEHWAWDGDLASHRCRCPAVHRHDPHHPRRRHHPQGYTRHAFSVVSPLLFIQSYRMEWTGGRV